jgi:putative endonuclease
MPAWMYILQLRSGKYYVGSTRNRVQRYKDHFAGTGCRTTKFDPPVAIEYEEKFFSYPEAHKRERQIKGWSHAKKDALIRDDIRELKRLAVRRKYR